MFYAHIIDLVEEWRPIVDDCRNNVTMHTLQVAHSLCAALTSEFPELCNEVQGMTSRLIDAVHEEVSAKLESLILREQVITHSHPLTFSP